MLLMFINEVAGQTWDEWFRQKTTQKKYLLQQIAALKVYAGYLSQGYTIAKGGLGIIQHIKQGDFGLHSNYFNSLSTVNPRIKSYIKIGSILSIETSIVLQTKIAIRFFSTSNQLNPVELKYIKNVFQNILNSCAATLDDLHNTLTSGRLRLKDDERIAAIDRLHDDMLDKETFVNSFCKSAGLLIEQRKHSSDEIKIDKQINGLR